MTAPAQGPAPDVGARLIEWITRHRRALIATGATIVIVAAGAMFIWTYRRNKEAAAASALDQARLASQSGNLPLAASDLSRLISSYGGTRAADEAVLILAQVRLQQGDDSAAVDELRSAIAGGLGSQFEAPAYGLLGTALENLGRLGEAAQTYESATAAAWYDFLKAQYLSDAGRAYAAAGDTTRAVAAYERVVRDYPSTSSTVEAKVRLAELRAASRKDS